MENRVEIKQEKQIQHAKTLVMGSTSFYQISIEFEHHILNIKQTHMCLSIANSNIPLLAFNEWTSHIKPNRAIIRFTKSLIEQI